MDSVRRLSGSFCGQSRYGPATARLGMKQNVDQFLVTMTPPTIKPPLVFFGKKGIHNFFLASNCGVVMTVPRPVLGEFTFRFKSCREAWPPQY
jgi:hypothetical protein